MTDPADSEDLSALATAAEVATAAAGAATQGPLGAAAAAALGTLSGKLLRDQAAQVAKKRLNRLELELERLVSEEPDMAAVVIPDDPEQSEIFFRIYRAIMDAKDERAVGPLVRLTSAYIGKKRDAFFFAAGKLFEELVGAEFETLRELLMACLGAPEEVEWIKATATDSTLEPKAVRIEWTMGQIGQAKPERHSEQVRVADGEFVSVVLALKRYGIARESGAGGAGAASAPGIMLIRRESALRIRRLLGGQSRA